MISVVLEAPRQLAVRDRGDPGSPGVGQALVRVLRVGVCGTDLHAYLGEQPLMTYPVVLGHELAVEVVALGPGGEAADFQVGDRCTVVPYLHDGTCDACRSGRTNCCETLEVLGVHRDGGMAERMSVPLASLIPANDVPLEALCLVEMLSVGAHAVRRAAPSDDDAVLVIGGGPIGLSVLASARGRASKVAVVEVDPARLSFLRSSSLVDAVIDARSDVAKGHADGHERVPVKHGVAETVRTVFDGKLPTVVIDATGNARSMHDALGLIAHGGRLVLVGHTSQALSFDNPTLHTREASILASRNATRADFTQVLTALRSGDIDPVPWITHRVGPEALPERMPGWATRATEVVKAVVEFGV